MNDFLKRKATVVALKDDRDHLSKGKNYLHGVTKAIKTVERLNQKIKHHKEALNGGVPDAK